MVEEFYQFPRLAELAVSDDDLFAYCYHLDAFKMDMTKRLTDLLELETPDWIIDPFCVHVETISLSLQEELIDLQNDCEEKARFKIMGNGQFWSAFSIRSQYATLCKRVKLLTLSFSTSYLVEKAFSAVVQLVTKQRNRHNISQGRDLRLLRTNMVPDVESIVQKTTHKCTLHTE